MITNEICIQEISEKFLLRDRMIVKIELLFELHVSISLLILLQENQYFLLKFNNVKEYSFYTDQADCDGYLVSHYKLFKNENLFYFSFDPYTEDRRIEIEDNNYIFSEEISGEILSSF